MHGSIMKEGKGGGTVAVAPFSHARRMTLFAFAADAFANLPFSVDRDRSIAAPRSFVRSFGVGSTFDSRILVCHSDGRTDGRRA